MTFDLWHKGGIAVLMSGQYFKIKLLKKEVKTCNNDSNRPPVEKINV